MDATSFVIQQAERRHIEGLIPLRALLLEQTSSASYVCRTPEECHNWKEQYRHWLYEVLENDSDIRVFVAIHGQEVIACSTGIIDRRAPARDCLNGYSGWIQSVVVAPSFRRQGVAATLLKSLTEWFAERKVSKIVLESTSGSETFYISQGFIPDQETLFIREI
ncbi:GNAT family N-acetyltransferase [Rahnella ecdela]|jgi:GNAT superfamily N-acetyltransferase|uniref:GNAT family N-acetyltransferase n=1 Tax=Rahnella ecdela TaxID=2816250 RepID=A0ABS6LE83_9GAMM|nr:GNAT family N-acetyltransferase [Rahnella ecdela]MBU9844834.1 GNAT family N-acetyltransferase [Rahnella ecdela]